MFSHMWWYLNDNYIIISWSHTYYGVSVDHGQSHKIINIIIHASVSIQSSFELHSIYPNNIFIGHKPGHYLFQNVTWDNTNCSCWHKTYSPWRPCSEVSSNLGWDCRLNIVNMERLDGQRCRNINTYGWSCQGRWSVFVFMF